MLEGVLKTGRENKRESGKNTTYFWKRRGEMTYNRPSPPIKNSSKKKKQKAYQRPQEKR